MSEVINVRVRKAIRQDSTRVPDAEIEEQIDRALDWVIRDTQNEDLEIADFTMATTGDDYFDDLIVFRTAWQIYVFLFQSGTRSKDPNAGNAAVFNVYEQNYLQMLMIEYPMKVRFSGGGNGVYHYANPSGSSSSGGGGSTTLPDVQTYVYDQRGDSGLWGDSTPTAEDLT